MVRYGLQFVVHLYIVFYGFLLVVFFRLWFLFGWIFVPIERNIIFDEGESFKCHTLPGKENGVPLVIRSTNKSVGCVIFC